MFGQGIGKRIIGAVVAAIVPFMAVADGHGGMFDGGWTLEPDASSLRFQSVKNLTKVESSSFATVSGAIDENGAATVRVALDSVDTKVDLRNVRMRFLLFETFQYPEAVITTSIDPATLGDLAERRRKIIELPYTLDLHGVAVDRVAEVAVTMISDELVAVSTSAPISISTSEHALDAGVQKLEEAANVEIVPSATVTFDFVFSRNAADGGTQVASTQTDVGQTTASAALEPEGDFDLAACVGRFEILSRTENIFFNPGSARLDPKSEPLLNSLVDIIARCPGLVVEVGGHTDSDGSDAANQRLSERRAGSVTDYLVSRSIPSERIVSVGYGESRPAFPNNNSENKRRNRRIEFAVVN